MEENRNNNDITKEIYDVQSWQKIHVQQLSYTRNLFIVLSLAALGFTLKLLTPELTPDYRILLKIVCVVFLTSILLGLFISFNESENYRIKYKIARQLHRNKRFENDEKQCTNRENLNRCLLLLQAIFLG